MIKKILIGIIVFAQGYTLPAQTLIWSQDAHPEGLQVNSIVFEGNGQSLLSGTNCHPAKLRRYNAADGEITWDYTVVESLECMMSIALSSDETHFTSIEESGHLMIFEYTESEPALHQTIDLGTTYAFSVDFAPQSDKIAAGCSNGKLKLYQVDGTALWSVAAHTNWVTAVDYAPDGAHIASGGSDDKVKIWNSDGTLFQTCSGHTGDITAVRFSADGQNLFSASMDKKVRIWESATGALLHTITVGNDPVVGLSLSYDGQYMATASGYDVKIWRLSDYTLLQGFETGTAAPTAISWSPTAHQLAVGLTFGKVNLYDVSPLLTDSKNISTPLEAIISPNPCNASADISWPANQSVQLIELFDLEGRLLWREKINAEQTESKVDFPESAPAGVYIVRLVKERGAVMIHCVAKQ